MAARANTIRSEQAIGHALGYWIVDDHLRRRMWRNVRLDEGVIPRRAWYGLGPGEAASALADALQPSDACDVCEEMTAQEVRCSRCDASLCWSCAASDSHSQIHRTIDEIEAVA